MSATLLEPDELQALAERVHRNEVFIANDPEAVSLSFGLLIGAMKDPAGALANVGALYEEYAKAGPKTINGRPFFYSAQFLHQDDLAPFLEALGALVSPAVSSRESEET